MACAPSGIQPRSTDDSRHNTGLANDFSRMMSLNSEQPLIESSCDSLPTKESNAAGLNRVSGMVIYAYAR